MCSDHVWSLILHFSQIVRANISTFVKYFKCAHKRFQVTKDWEGICWLPAYEVEVLND